MLLPSINFSWPISLKWGNSKRQVEPSPDIVNESLAAKAPSFTPVPSALPTSRKSDPSDFNYASAGSYFSGLGSLPAPWFLKLIPLMRRLAQTNFDISQAVRNTVSLGNTGHKLFFDPKVKPEQVDKMRNHILNKQKTWATGTAGLNGLADRLFSQLLISGAVSGEWVPNTSLTGLDSCMLINPELIRFKLDRRKTHYEPYQISSSKTNPDGLIPLNPNTYKYFALNGDGESPYGCPPYLPALRGIRTQTTMLKNIDFVVEQLGVMGFVELLIDTPAQGENENLSAYEARLNNRLNEAKERISGGLKEGAIVGYKDSHEMNFNSISRDFSGVKEIFNLNETLIGSGLDMDGALMGRSGSGSETQITIIFTKLLSQLKNFQNVIREFLEYGVALELRLAGFEFDFVRIQFNRSTIQDDLKYQQAEEIKIRNLLALYQDGQISMEQYADEMGLEKPDQAKPRIDRNAPAANNSEGAEKKKKREAGKDKSDKKVRDKNKPQGTIKK